MKIIELCCFTLSHTDIITLFSALITGGVAAIGAIIAVSLDKLRVNKQRKFQIQDRRNQFRTKLLKYLKQLEEELISNDTEENIKILPVGYLQKILSTFDNKFFSDTYLESNDVFCQIIKFQNEIKFLLTNSVHQTQKKCVESITTLDDYIQKKLREARGK